MASVRLLMCLFSYFFIVFAKTLSLAKAEDCVTYNFEYNVESNFLSDKGICKGLSPWIARKYTETWISSPNPDSTSVVAARSSLSCGTTFEFPMSGGGTVEVNVYMESNFMTDQILVSAMQALPEGNSVMVGSALISAMDSDFVTGWRLVRIVLVGTGTYQGYISILGMASAKSLVLVDSFRYIPPSLDEDSCVIYEDISGSTAETIIETTTESITTKIPATITTPILYTEETSITPIHTTTLQPDVVEECVTYNFETDFDIRFSPDNYLCKGLLSWQLENYTSIDIGSPNPQSTVFMTPHEEASCISSTVFKMEPYGTVEANVFMEPVQALDHIIIIAQRVTEKDYDTVAGYIKYHPGNEVFVPGWNVIRFSLLDLTSFNGYLIFIGGADKSSTVFVDSVRYIPPLTPPEDASCDVY